MDPNTPMVLAGASYASRDDAVEAFKIVWGARHQGEFDHMDVAVLAKDHRNRYLSSLVWDGMGALA
jgi:hypothetical protein